MMELSESRIRHSAAVAAKMAGIVAANREKYPYFTPEDAFTLGWLHDIGYAFCPGMHEQNAGARLGIDGYLYADEVYYHGSFDPPSNCDTKELRLLQYCDMTTGPDGREMTMRERVDDIRKRYGETSAKAVNAQKLMERLERLIDAETTQKYEQN